MKKTIRMNERDITRMVMEAVNELDWKTGYNAHLSAYDKIKASPLFKIIDMSPEKISEIKNDIEKKQNDGTPKTRINKYIREKYGLNSVRELEKELVSYSRLLRQVNTSMRYAHSKLFGDKEQTSNTGMGLGYGKPSLSYYRNFESNGKDGSLHMNITKDKKNIDAITGKFKGWDFDGYPEWKGEKEINPYDVMDDEEKYISDEMTNYVDGNYEYKPYKDGGKGWTKKNESIVREAVNRTIRKYIK